MAKLKSKVVFETLEGEYTVDEKIGEGGAGIVYGGLGPKGEAVAVKVLSADRATSDKRRRFKNEIGFLVRVNHPHVVAVLDHGIAKTGTVQGGFYVMRRYDSSLRSLIKKGIEPKKALSLFVQILKGVETAHLLKAVHRDLKPENILYDAKGDLLAVADFGVASFTADLMLTTVETKPQQRLMNANYAAPEQRVVGGVVGTHADIFALGLILHEMFTGQVPHGLEYETIGRTAPQFGYLDELVRAMLINSASGRLGTVAQVQSKMEQLNGEMLARQKISEIDGTVVETGGIENPLAHEPPKLIGYDWADNVLHLKLDRPVNAEWIDVLQHHMGNFSNPMNQPPGAFRFRGVDVQVNAASHEAQNTIDHFKGWLPQATLMLRHRLQHRLEVEKHTRELGLQKQRAAEEERLKVLGSLRI